MNFTQRVIEILKAWRDLTRAVEALLVDNLAATSPWLAPIIPAFLAFSNMTSKLEFPFWVALVGAITIETLGLATVHTVFTLWDYNDDKRKTDQQAPVWVAVVVAVLYIAIVLTVNVLLDYQRDQVQLLAQALLSLLSVVASLTLAIRANHTRRLDNIKAEKEERRELRRETARNGEIWRDNLAGKSPQVAETRQISPESASGEVLTDWRRLSTADKDAIRGMSTAQILAAYPVSPRTAREWKEKATANGYHPQPESETETV